MTLEQCKACYKRGYSCCQVTPIFYGEELAKLHFESDILDKKRDSVKIYRVDNDQYVIVNHTVDASKGIKIHELPCVFLTEEGTCSIHDCKPSICSDFGNNGECGFSHLSPEEISSLPKEELDKIAVNTYKKLINKTVFNVKPNLFNSRVMKQIPLNKLNMKHQKDDMVMILIAHILERLTDEELEYLKVQESVKYELIVMSDNTNISSIKFHRYKTTHDNIYKPLFDLYNKMISHIMVKDYAYLRPTIDKLNRLVKGITLKPCEASCYNDTERKMLLLASIVYQYYIDRKNKPKYIAGLIKYKDFYNIIKYHNEKCGGKLFKIVPEVRCVMDNASRYLKSIMKNK